MKIKKIIAGVAFSVATLGLCVPALGVASAEDMKDFPFFTISTKDIEVAPDAVEQGAEYTVDFLVTKNSNIAGFKANLTIPYQFEFAGLTIGDVFGKSIDASELESPEQIKEVTMPVYQYTVEDNELAIILNSPFAAQEGTTLFSLTYKMIDALEETTLIAESYNFEFTDVDGNTLRNYGIEIGNFVVAEQEETILYGDFDLDGAITLKDLIGIQRYILTYGEISYEEFMAGDIDADGYIELNDAQYLTRYLAGAMTFEELQALSKQQTTFTLTAIVFIEGQTEPETKEFTLDKRQPIYSILGQFMTSQDVSVSAYYDADKTMPVGMHDTLSANTQIYVFVEQAMMINLGVCLNINGEIMSYGTEEMPFAKNVDLDALGAQLTEMIKATSGSMGAEFAGFYGKNETGYYPLEKGYKIQENDTIYIMFEMASVSYEGTYFLGEYYYENYSSGYRIADENTQLIVDKDNNYKLVNVENDQPTILSQGTLSAMMGGGVLTPYENGEPIPFTSTAITFLGEDMFMIDHVFNGSKYTTQEELKAIAGEYAFEMVISSEGETMPGALVVYDNSVAYITIMGLSFYCGYELDTESEELTIIVDLTTDKMAIVLDLENHTALGNPIFENY